LRWPRQLRKLRRLRQPRRLRRLTWLIPLKHLGCLCCLSFANGRFSHFGCPYSSEATSGRGEVTVRTTLPPQRRGTRYNVQGRRVLVGCAWPSAQKRMRR
jgi:hypothetical protein